MAIHEFSDEEKAKIKADAAERFKSGALVTYVADPVDVTLALAPFDRVAYSTYSDKEDADKQSAYSWALMERLLFPDFVGLAPLNAKWPALAKEAAVALEREAGSFIGSTCEPLDLAKLPAGLSLADAQRIQREAKGTIWHVALADGSASFVLAMPEAHMWIAARTAMDDATKKVKGRIDAIDPYVKDSIVWSSAPLTGGAGILDTRPALIWPLWAAYKKAGGEGAAVRTFRL